jgi:xylulokinase
MSIVLACDLGGTSFRAGLVDRAGVVLAQAVTPSPQAVGEGGRSEIDAEAWWACLLAVAGQLVCEEPALFGSVSAIAICGVTRTQVLLDPSGLPLRPAMTWNDVRAGEIAAELAHRHAGRHREAAQINAFHPLARLVWLRAHEPEVFGRVRHVLDPKDYLNARLTGRAASDAISLARLLAAASLDGGTSLLAAAGVPAYVVPPILGPCDSVGPVLAGLPEPFGRLAGVPVFCCSNDTWAAVAGLGALRAGYAYNISGTTEVLGVIGDTPAAAEGLLSVDWGGLLQLGGPSLNGADTVPWLLSVLGQTPSDPASSLAGLMATERQPQPLLFLPFLQGERVPHWDPALRGAFIGLARQHGAVDLAWAVLEGIGFLNRDVLQRAEAALGWQAHTIRFGGGAALNPLWCQIKADICRRPVEVGTAREPGMIGAAAVAWTGLGQFPSLAEAQDRMVRIKHRFEPDLARAETYDRLFSLFVSSGSALAPISRQLAGLTLGAGANTVADLGN